MNDRAQQVVGRILGYGIGVAYFFVSVVYLNWWIGMIGLVIIAAMLVYFLERG
jgi:uncharacterized membrane protein YgaE (UPF0421/DUF939 family)